MAANMGGGGGAGAGAGAGAGGGAAFEALSGLGHFGPLEAPDTFAARVWERGASRGARQRTHGGSSPPRSRL